MTGRFKDKVVIVTGGGSGFGRCIAHELASLGAQVVITGRKQEKLETVQAEIVEDGGSCAVRSFDIRDEDFLRGHYRFNLPGSPGATIVNDGQLNAADGGFIVLAAERVVNNGGINAPAGAADMAAGGHRGWFGPADACDHCARGGAPEISIKTAFVIFMSDRYLLSQGRRFIPDRKPLR